MQKIYIGIPVEQFIINKSKRSYIKRITVVRLEMSNAYSNLRHIYLMSKFIGLMKCR